MNIHERSPKLYYTVIHQIHQKSPYTQKCLAFFMIEVYKYLKDLSPQIINYILKLRKNNYNLRNVNLVEIQNL